MPTPILTTKLYIPPPRPGAVLRPHLIERLDEGLAQGCRLTLVSASAGFGKTTLLSTWVAGCGLPVAWLSLDSGDSDPARFLTYLVAALQTLAPSIGAGVLAALESPRPPQTDALLTGLLNEIDALPEPFVLVLDDWHAIDSEPDGLDRALSFVVDHLPPGMHLVIASREDPALPLARLRARGRLTELRAADLRFTPAEAAEFLNQVMGMDLSQDDVAALENRTEGWVAGLQLAALSMRGLQDTAGFIRSFSGSHRFVLDYMLEEVLHQQSEPIQAFLLRTSLLERLCGPLCDAVLDSPSAGQDTLEYLERANLFVVPLDSERRWYRYHHLFGELLRQRLGQTLAAPEVAALHIRASAWYEQNDLGLAAFHHATEAGDVARAERLIEARKMGLHYRSVAVTVLAWLNSLPKATLDARPRLWVRSATLSLMAGRIAQVEERLQGAEAAFAALGVSQNRVPVASADAETRDLFGQMAMARAVLALTRNDPKAMIVQARLAREYLSPDNLVYRFDASWALASAHIIQGDRAAAAEAALESLALAQTNGHVFSMILAMQNMGRVQELENDLRQAAASYRRVLELAGEHPQPNAGESHLGLARIHYEWNDLEQAGQHGEDALRLLRQFDSRLDRFIRADVFLARLTLAKGDVAGAAALLAETERAARQNAFLLRLPEVAEAQVLVLLRQGDLEAAARLAAMHELPLSRARVHLARGDPEATLAVMEPFRREAESRGWKDKRLQGLVLQAVARQAQGELDDALQVVGEALALAEPGGLVRLFIDEGAPIARLLAAASARGMMPAYVARLRAGFEAEERRLHGVPDSPLATPAAPPPQSTLEPLSPRELEVLRLVAQGLSNREISQRLFLALSTVKGHNLQIFAKLHVQRRTEAVARARELGLL